MKMIAVDDEWGALDSLSKTIEKADPTAELQCFRTSGEAIRHAEHHRIDVAFLDVEMPEIDGLQLAKILKDMQNEINIIFTTGYIKYAKDAFSLRASGYLQKPVLVGDVKQELVNLRYPVIAGQTGIYVRTFGNFDLLVDGDPVCFHRAKSKEILAYLVDRKGATVNKKEIASIIWEDGEYTRSRQFQIQTLITEMIRTLKEAGAEKMVRKGYNSYSVDPTRFECDYYRFMAGDANAVNAYHGEYMSNYSWAEFTAGGIAKIKTGAYDGLHLPYMP